MRRRWFAVRWLVVPIFLFVTGSFIGAEACCGPPRVSRGLSEQLKAYFSAEQAEVVLTAPPWGWEPLFGRIPPELSVVLINAEADGLKIARAEFSGADIRFDADSLWRGKDFVYAAASQLSGTLTVTEQALNEIFLARSGPGTEFARGNRAGGNIILTGGRYRFGPAALTFNFGGAFWKSGSSPGCGLFCKTWRWRGQGFPAFYSKF